MKRIIKGTPGYRDYKKKVEVLRTILYFLIVAAIFILGYLQTKTRLNLLTVVAILGCLPASKALVGVVTRFPYHSVNPRLVKEVEEKASHTTRVYDLIITSKDHVMPVECVVISNETVFGYTSGEKVNLNHLSRHIRDMLVQNKIDYSSVKFYNSYKAFMARAEGLDSIAAVEKEDTSLKEDQIRRLLLNLSL